MGVRRNQTKSNMTNNKKINMSNKQTLIEKFLRECGKYGDTAQIPDDVIEKYIRKEKANIRIAELDAIDITIIKHCAEESTSKASSYTEGYTEGYKRAVDYMTDTLKNKIKINENGTNSTSVGITLGTTSTTRLCTVFIPNKFVFQDRCKNCGNQQHQHVIISNTK
jgi:hypothetical protein